MQAVEALRRERRLPGLQLHLHKAIPMGAGSETHGGTDVFLGAIGKGAENFTGVITSTEVIGLVRKASGL